MPSKLGKLLKKAMVISVEDQVTYCNRTVQVGPHVMVVECATLDVSGTSVYVRGRGHG